MDIIVGELEEREWRERIVSLVEESDKSRQFQMNFLNWFFLLTFPLDSSRSSSPPPHFFFGKWEGMGGFIEPAGEDIPENEDGLSLLCIRLLSTHY